MTNDDIKIKYDEDTIKLHNLLEKKPTKEKIEKFIKENPGIINKAKLAKEKFIYFLIVGFVCVYFTIGFLSIPATSPWQRLGYLWLFGSIVFLSIGVLELVLESRRAKVRSVWAKVYEYLETFPYFCENCKKFTYMLREYCENCGNKDSLRKATKEDYLKYR